CCANAPALRAMPVDQHPHVQFRTLPFSRIERVEYTFTPIVLFRPILPEDEPQLRQFIAQVTKEDLYYRYFSEINEFTHEDLA
ncbi:hypothetical protein KU406_24365, partial [Salmonella enterica subsp. enterica serovar Montevideo]|nr:hypothetical protein [Salmonella enterica subsp. enterica serovar Montevideo]